MSNCHFLKFNSFYILNDIFKYYAPSFQILIRKFNIYFLNFTYYFK